jgi:hypothetical protein
MGRRTQRSKMSKPLVADIPHELGRREARNRLERGVGQIRAHIAPYASSIEDHWTDDRLNFRIAALGQALSGSIEIFEDLVRIEIALPGFLGFIGNRIAGRIRQQATLLLEKK